MKWQATIMQQPTAKGRPRITRSGIAFTPKKTRNAEAEMKLRIEEQNPIRFEGPVKITALCFFEKPKSAPKQRVFPTVKPDLDNVLKMILDCMNRRCFDDDKQVIDIEISKRYDTPERIELTVQEVSV